MPDPTVTQVITTVLLITRGLITTSPIIQDIFSGNSIRDLATGVIILDLIFEGFIEVLVTMIFTGALITKDSTPAFIQDSTVRRSAL